MKKLLLSTVIAMGSASVALAGSPGPAAAVAPVAIAAPTAGVDWSGIYAGGLVSFDGGTFSTYVNNALNTTGNLDATTSYGFFAGYNKQVNALVFGGEVAYTTGNVGLTGFPGNYIADRIDLKARAGYSFGRAMVYGVVGYSFAEFVLPPDTHASSGLNFGAGVDVMVTDRIFVGAEYLTRNLSGDGALSPQNRIDANLGSASIRVGMKF